MMAQVFAYWQQQDQSPLAAFTEYWQSLFPGFRTYGDGDVLPLLQLHFPEAVESYRRLAIPAARSDLARLLLLYAYGGMYVGSHLAVADVKALRAALELLECCDGVLVERAPPLPQLRNGQRTFINGLMIAATGSSWLLDVCALVLANLDRQWKAERAGPSAPYDIWLLTGPGALTQAVSNEDLTDLRPPYKDRIAVRSESELGLRRNAFVPATGQPHWSVRQRTEFLFAPPG